MTSIATPCALRNSVGERVQPVGRASDEDKIMATGGQPASVNGADAARSASNECGCHRCFPDLIFQQYQLRCLMVKGISDSFG